MHWHRLPGFCRVLNEICQCGQTGGLEMEAKVVSLDRQEAILCPRVSRLLRAGA